MNEIKEWIEGFKPKKPDHAYKMGYDCGKNGATEENCHFTIFGTKEGTKEWERGKRDAENDQAI